MNKVGITINELGPVKNQVIELKPVMLFTGESSLGKSYVNFLAYYLFYVFSSERMYDFLLEKIGIDVNDKKEFSFELTSMELIDWMQNDVREFFVYLYNFDDFRCDVKFDFKDVEDIFAIKYTRDDFKNNKDKDFFSFNIEINGRKNKRIALSQRLEGYIGNAICQQLCICFLGMYIHRSYLLPPGRALAPPRGSHWDRWAEALRRQDPQSPSAPWWCPCPWKPRQGGTQRRQRNRS